MGVLSFRGLALGFAGHQALGMWAMRVERNRKYSMAREVADALGKPLLVVGGPYGSNPMRQWFGMKAHGPGDVCTDIDPNACRGGNFIPGDIRQLPFADGEFGVSFCSHVLEHMPSAADCQAAWRELHRVADYVFFCVPPRTSLFAWLVPDHHLWVRDMGQGVLEVQERATGQTYTVTL